MEHELFCSTMASKQRFARSLGIRESLGTKKRIDKLMQPRKVGDAQSVSEHISRQRTEPGVYPNSEQLRKHSGRASGAANTMGTGASLVKWETGAQPK